MKIGIIGSSQVASGLTPSKIVYETAVEAVKKEIDMLGIPYHQIELVSGGSSWADHIAVTLFEMLRPSIRLTLYLPAIPELGEYSNKSYYGRELNARHRVFSEQCFSDKEESLKQISDLYAEATEKAETTEIKVIIDRKGFKSRNTSIANESEYLIAVSNCKTVTGGTKDTWDKFDKGSSLKKLLSFL